MTIGIPNEIKPSESRVGMTPAGVFELTRRQHAVIVQSGAGLGSGFSDEDYLEVAVHLPRTLEEFHPIHPRHLQVGEQDVGSLYLERRECLAAL